MNAPTQSAPALPPREGMTPSHKALCVLIALIVFAKLVEMAVHVPFVIRPQQMNFSWMPLLFYVALLLLGLGFAHIIGFPGMWEEKVNNRQRIWLPIAIGVILGTGLLAVDHAVGYSHLFAMTFGKASLAVPFPYSVLLEGYTAVCAAIFYILFPVSFGVWFFGTLLLARRWPRGTFWVIAMIVPLFEPRSIASRLGWTPFHPGAVSVGLVAVLVLVYVMDLAGAILLRRFGFTAALVMRVSAVAVWHIIGRI